MQTAKQLSVSDQKVSQNPMDLSPWEMKALMKWKAARPRMVLKLKLAGTLRAALELAALKAGNHLESLLSMGVPFDQAKEVVEEAWINLPEEKEVPKLSPDQMPYLQETTA